MGLPYSWNRLAFKGSNPEPTRQRCRRSRLLRDFLMTTLVTGAAGQLGRTFGKKITQDVVFANRNSCDLSNPKALKKQLDKINPKTIINCAAYTAVDEAESNPEIAFRINADAVGEMSDSAQKRERPSYTFLQIMFLTVISFTIIPKKTLQTHCRCMESPNAAVKKSFRIWMSWTMFKNFMVAFCAR